jgi:4-amino-4-deoxy-L-arabinose transferase-like glycosyltransferase
MKRTTLFLTILLCLFLAGCFLTLPRIALQNDDASGYAVAVRNTIVYHQWFNPMLSHGDPTALLDKPPLGIWLLAWAPKVFGINELTIHIPNVVYFTLIILIIYFFLSRYASRETALYTTLIAATSLCLVVYSRAPKLDVPLTLCLLISHLLLYGYLKEGKPAYAYGLAISAAAGFLVKSGLGVLPIVLTGLAGAVYLPEIREKLRGLLFSWRALLCLAIFFALTGGVLWAQALALKEQWPLYLQMILVKSPYNPGYLGLGFHPSIIGFLLITIFPWTPLFLTGLKVPRNLSLSTFCSLWFWPNFLFLLFCYKFTDLRTFTSFVPPMAILAGSQLEALRGRTTRPGLGLILWQLFFLLLFTVILIAGLINPVNPQGISLVHAIVPFALFTLSLVPLTSYLWKPSSFKFVLSFALLCLAYSVLFYNTKPLADDFNPDIKWPAVIKKYQNEGFSYYIYRPRDRARFMSPDLFYVDFLAGPADRYFWDKDELRGELKKGKAIVLSDTESWGKLKLKLPVLAQDTYSLIVKAE